MGGVEEGRAGGREEVGGQDGGGGEDEVRAGGRED